MKKTILCLSIFVLVSSCFATNAIAKPTISGIQGGYGVTATVEDAKGRDWQMTIEGPFVISGMKSVGTISSDSAKIQTPVFGLGHVCITVTVNRIILPDITESRCAFMVGPFVLFVNNAQYQCDSCDGDCQGGCDGDCNGNCDGTCEGGCNDGCSGHCGGGGC